MADVWNAAFHGETAKLQGLIDRGGDVNYKTVRRRLAARPRPPSHRARALRPKEPAASDHGTSCAPSLECVPAALPATLPPFRPPPPHRESARQDGERPPRAQPRVRPGRAALPLPPSPSLPPPPSRPPLLLLPPTGPLPPSRSSPPCSSCR
jgi:hypothetical protein